MPETDQYHKDGTFNRCGCNVLENIISGVTLFQEKDVEKAAAKTGI
jgi:hypothetical protein